MASKTLFAILAARKPDELQQRLDQREDLQVRSISLGEWLIVASASVTARELSDSLGITDGSVSSAVVVSVGTYFGRTSPEVWEWITAKMSDGDGS